ncbi:MAG: 2-oxoacid:acceptor oxidoreductase family protein [Candidatus Kapabacteria bacterium]|nr:2-oxoacid:acceptor oxidoreductase family protein [Candidatus Kapabacteria bacterium]
MSKFRDIIDSPSGTKIILQGNAAFALGVIHAGYHAADGYPGTPSTEVIDKSLSQVQDKITVGWSVSEAVAVAVGLGHAISGSDVVVTMKVPGVFQAGDAISSAAFFSGDAGAFVFYICTDYVPSSTQHVIDPRYFFSSICIPVLEPRNHQELYDIAATAADISRQFHTPVAILVSGILAHSEGLVETKAQRIIVRKPVPKNMTDWMCLPFIARNNYNRVIQERLPALSEWAEESNLVNITTGDTDFGIITCGINDIVVREALQLLNLKVPILSLAKTNPLPKKIIRKFWGSVPGKVFVIEDGYRFLWEKITFMGLDVIGKEETSTITDWSPDTVLSFLSEHIKKLDFHPVRTNVDIKPAARPASICPGCPYRAIAVTIQKFKKQKKIIASFGDIGCSTLLYFFNALDTVLCMGASDSMRQGFVLSRPELAGKVVSIIGDSTECHSGLDSTRNGVFRNVPGVKIILDNRITAMTGGQCAPSSPTNLSNQENKFDLKRAVEAEGCRTVVVDGFNLEQVESELKKSLDLANEGVFTAIIIEGDCINEVAKETTIQQLEFDYNICVNCGICNICTGIELDEDKRPSFTVFCTDCGPYDQVCLQICPKQGAIYLPEKADKVDKKALVAKSFTYANDDTPEIELLTKVLSKEDLPNSIRIAIRGIGGQGNLFFGKALSELALRTPFSEMRIVKGDTHGMAQKGGSVISLFCCGNVYSPVPAPNTVDILVAMEINEVLRDGFLDLLKPDGILIFNVFKALPVNAKKEDYPDFDEIKKQLPNFNIIEADFYAAAHELGDVKGLTANVVALGLLSTVKPCDAIPESIWLDAIAAVSPNERAKNVNFSAFRKGRKL